jgi:hypothetical protein
LHLGLGLPSGYNPSGFPTKILHASHLSHMCYIPRPPHPPWFDCSNNTQWKVEIMKQLCPSSCHFLPLWSSSSARWSQRSPGAFLSQWQRPRLTPIQNNTIKQPVTWFSSFKFVCNCRRRDTVATHTHTHTHTLVCSSSGRPAGRVPFYPIRLSKLTGKIVSSLNPSKPQIFSI